MAEVSAAAIAGSRRVPDRAAPASTGSLRRRGAWLAVAKQFVADSPLEGDGFEPLVPQGRRDCPFRDHLDWPTAPSLPRETTYLAREPGVRARFAPAASQANFRSWRNASISWSATWYCTAPAVTPSTGRAVAGTFGSNPSPSSGESANHRFLRGGARFAPSRPRQGSSKLLKSSAKTPEVGSATLGSRRTCAVGS